MDAQEGPAPFRPGQRVGRRDRKDFRVGIVRFSDTRYTIVALETPHPQTGARYCQRFLTTSLVAITETEDAMP